MSHRSYAILHLIAAGLGLSAAACEAADVAADADPVAEASSAVTSLTVVNTASPPTAPDACRSGYTSPACSMRPFDARLDLAAPTNGHARPAVAKDCIAGYPGVHEPGNVNDGRYGNGASWVSAGPNSWIKIDLGQPTLIDGLRFGRDRTGGYDDRDPGQFTVAVAQSDNVYANADESNDSTEYTTVFDSSQNGFSGTIAGPQTIRAGFTPVVARYVKLKVTNSGAAIDEIEITSPGTLEATRAPSLPNGADQCRPGYGAPGCTLRPFDTSFDLASPAGGVARPAVAKDCMGGYPGMHEPGNVNDGRYGNGASWVSASQNSWVKIDLGQVKVIDGLRFGRDRTGNYDDRDPGQFTVAVAPSDDVYANGNDNNDGSEYTTVFDSSQSGFSGNIAGDQTIRVGFAPIAARYVKLKVENQGAAVDEIEVSSAITHEAPSPWNGAAACRAGYGWPQCSMRPFDTSMDVASTGVAARPAVAKDCIAGNAGAHEPGNINDGLYGNGASWVSASPNSWVKIDLGQLRVINGVRFGRDRMGQYDDRDPGQFIVAVAPSDNVYANANDSNDAAEYTTVFDSSQKGFSGNIAGAETVRAWFTPVVARYVKVQVANAGAAIDEIEVSSAAVETGAPTPRSWPGSRRACASTAPPRASPCRRRPSTSRRWPCRSRGSSRTPTAGCCPRARSPRITG